MVLLTAGMASSYISTLAPKHSDSTVRSIMLSDASVGRRSARIFMPSASVSLSLRSWRTLMPISLTTGNERTGTAFLTGLLMTSCFHFNMSMAENPPNV